MARIVHNFGEKSFSKNSGDASFILANNAGSFAYIAPEISSEFQGFFAALGNNVFRIIESIALKGEVRVIKNRFYCIERKKSSITEKFFVPQYYNSLCYEVSKKAAFEVFLDCRKALDFRSWGKQYRAYQKDGTIVVEFIKSTDAREDNSSGKREFRIYLAIKTDGSHKVLGEWVERSYNLDKSRNSLHEMYVYKALRLFASKAVFSVALNENDAVSEANYVFRNMKGFQLEQKRLHRFLGSFALKAAQSAFDSLLTRRGIYAGLPWFFQHWSRDALVSVSAAHKLLRKSIVLSYIRKLGSNGRLPNVEGSAPGQGNVLGSSDSVGWLFLRARQLYLEKAFNETEIRELTAALEKSLQLQQKNYGKDGLIYGDKNETWMDTSYNDGGREGFPIEVQALTLSAYNFLWLLTKGRNAKSTEIAMAARVRQRFWNGKFLADLAGDFTVRPNIFIAAYAYPQLLKKSEWETCISNTLPKLWLDWGGLASIDKSHPLFQPNYTGENNASYHRGDSWYWINNIAAIVMAKVNKKKFHSYIEKIKTASINDLLWKGAVGCCSELSSASQQKAEGCLSQAWSAATLVELLKFVGQHH